MVRLQVEVIIMAKPLVVVITPEQREELEDARDHHPIPYLRERSAAILKIADGQSGLQVALNGLLKPRDPDTVYTWVRRYKTEGFEGLVIKPGRGRKPAFFGQYPDEKVKRRPKWLFCTWCGVTQDYLVMTAPAGHYR